MPAVTIHFPRSGMDSTDKVRFKRAVKKAVATHMDAKDPITDVRTRYGDDPDKFIDLVMVPYDSEDAELTTPYVATIVTYDWPDRMAGIDRRIRTIAEEVRKAFTTDMEARCSGHDKLISFTFIGKVSGAWHEA